MKISLRDVLWAIESIAGDDFCEDLGMTRYTTDEQLSRREKIAHDKLMAIYKLAHAFNKSHSCHYVHDNWRRSIRNYQSDVEERRQKPGIKYDAANKANRQSGRE